MLNAALRLLSKIRGYITQTLVSLCWLMWLLWLFLRFRWLLLMLGWVWPLAKSLFVFYELEYSLGSSGGAHSTAIHGQSCQRDLRPLQQELQQNLLSTTGVIKCADRASPITEGAKASNYLHVPGTHFVPYCVKGSIHRPVMHMVITVDVYCVLIWCLLV